MITKQLHIFIILVVFMLSTCKHISGQYLRNGTIDGQVGTDIVPPEWNTDNEWSNPDNYAEFSIPSPSGLPVFRPVDGVSFANFRSRGATHNDFFDPYQREYIYQHLSNPLEPHSCFEFKVALASSPYYQVDDLNPEMADTALPLRFQVWGGYANDLRAELLVETEPIGHEEWVEYTEFFSTEESSFTHLLIEVACDTIEVYPESYNGFMFVDHLRIERVGTVDTVAQHYRTYLGDGVEVLLPDATGTSYWWSPYTAVSDPTLPNPILMEFEDQITVKIMQEHQCDVYEIFNYILDCSTLHPENSTDTIDFFYKYVDSLLLSASEGIEWEWNPGINLTATDVQNPYLLDYHHYYEVDIIDKYGCEFEERFSIIWNCDTLYPGGVITVLDTTLVEYSTFPLEVNYGEATTGLFSPPLYIDYSSDPPIAAPRSSISYSIEVNDRYNCLHNEVFSFEVPLRIHNVITPNQDGYNDCFAAYGLPPHTSLQLFDKTGSHLLTIYDFEMLDCWEGTDNRGDFLKSGTYWYALENNDIGFVNKGFLFIRR